MRNFFFLLLKVLMTLGLLFWLLGHVEWRVVGDILLHLAWPFLVLYLIFQIFGTLVSAKKWTYLARAQNYTLSLRDAFFVYLTGAFINNFLPSTIGGDAYRTLWLGKSGDRWKSFTVVFFDRVSGLLALFLLAGIGSFVLPWDAWVSAPWLILLSCFVFLIAFITLVGIVYAYGIFEMIMKLANLLPWKQGASFIKRFEIFSRGHVYLEALGYSLLFAFVGSALNNYFLFQSIGVDLTPLSFLSVIFLATLVANIPLTINNIGIKEWSYIFFFGLLGVSPELAVSVALLSRFLQMLLSFIALPHYLRTRSESNEKENVLFV